MLRYMFDTNRMNTAAPFISILHFCCIYIDMLIKTGNKLTSDRIRLIMSQTSVYICPSLNCVICKMTNYGMNQQNTNGYMAKSICSYVL
jgi:hypothetical protein